MLQNIGSVAANGAGVLFIIGWLFSARSMCRDREATGGTHI